jgi:hypothetical protein
MRLYAHAEAQLVTTPDDNTRSQACMVGHV